MATALLSGSDVGTIVSAITDQIVANLPFIAAIVAFGIIGGLVYGFVYMPIKDKFNGGSVRNTMSNYFWYRKKV